MRCIAHGFWERNQHPYTIGHEGNTMNFSSNLVIVPEEKLAIVVLTNLASEINITTGIARLIIGDDLQNPMKSNIDPSNLPSVKDVMGHYIFARNSHSTIHEIVSYFTPITATVTGENKLLLDIAGDKATYKQIAPYFFELEHSESGSFREMMPRLFAEQQKGRIVRLSFGQFKDMIPVSKDRTPSALMTYAILAITSLLYFLCVPILLVFRYMIRKKEREQFLILILG